MRINKAKVLNRLPFMVAAVVLGVFSVKPLVLNLINPIESATALSITAITSNFGPTEGGDLVTITGDFGIPSIQYISAGVLHVLALDNNGMIWAWGSNWQGQLGNGTSGWCDDYGCYDETSATPVAVDVSGVLAGRHIIQIATGDSHSLALDDEGRIFSWGAGDRGQLGNGTNTNSNIPVGVDMSGVLYGRDIVQIAAGSSHSLALDSEGNIFAWGRNDVGQLGNSTTNHSNIPVLVNMSGVLADRDIVRVSTGGSHSLALDSEGNVFTWGWNGQGQLGNGTTTNSNVPVAVDMSGVLADKNIIRASSHAVSFVLDREGSVFAWGPDGIRLGSGTNNSSTIPVAVDMSGVLAGRQIVQVSTSTNHSLALDSEGNVFAWGINSGGSLGTGLSSEDLPHSNIPVAVDMSGALAGRDIIQVSVGQITSYALDSEGNVFAWGNNYGLFGNGISYWCDDYGCYSPSSPIPIFSFSLNTLANPITSVTLGGLQCIDIQIINPTTITCITPAHPAGVVDVVVNTLHGSATLPGGYTYIDLPDVPNTGYERVLIKN